MNETLLLRENQLMLLLAGMGVESVSGLFTDKAGLLSSREIICTLEEMISNRQISPGEDCFVVSQPILNIVWQIGATVRTLILRFPEKDMCMSCFCADRILVCQSVPNQKDLLRFRWAADIHELFLWLREADVLPVFPTFLTDQELSEQLWTDQVTTFFHAELWINGVFEQRVSASSSALAPPELVMTWKDGSSARYSWQIDSLERILGSMIVAG